jgi:hypothetical protein
MRTVEVGKLREGVDNFHRFICYKSWSPNILGCMLQHHLRPPIESAKCPKQNQVCREAFRWIFFPFTAKTTTWKLCTNQNKQYHESRFIILWSIDHRSFSFSFPITCKWPVISTWLKIDEFLISEWIHKIMHQGST